MSTDKQPVFGIDLGTTNSCIARISDASRKAEVMPNADSELVTPSVVYFDAKDIIVGKIARNYAIARPELVCSHVKREMSKEPQHVRPLKYHGVDYSPEAVSALILRKVVADALELEGLPRDTRVQAVITVPAYFGTIGKNATLQAGRLADIDVLYVAPEPVAAAIAYGLDRATGPETLLVYDLGGGTFDVTVVETDGASARVVAFDGERLLGGLDWDRDIVNWFRQKVADQHGVELPTDDLALEQQLMQKAEETKKGLSRFKKQLLAVEFQGRSYGVELSVDEFEALTAGRLETTIEKTNAVIAAARERGVKNIDRLLLVGGSSRMPAVTRELRQANREHLEPLLHEPDLVVAKGAALLAGMIQKGAFKVDMTGEAEAPAAGSRLVTMLTPKGLGIEVHDARTQRDVVRYLVPKNSELPAKGSETYGTFEDNQPAVNIRIFEERGEESDRPEENTLLHETPIELPSGLRARSPIEVTFRVDDGGVLHVFLRESTSGKSWEVKVDKFSRVDDGDVLRLKPARERVA